ncbi:MAG: YidB family protein [Terracidiphilus sp.]
MSLFDSLEQEVSTLADGNAAADSGIMGHVMDLVNNPQTGGLQGLVQQFQSNGLGEVVNSWVGNGANQPISGDQIAQVVGQDKLNEIASKLGMQPDQISGLIAQHLPGVIDKMTPQGQTN